MGVKIGISPICWQNDDLPDLTADFTMEQALQEARQIGYTGVERGQRMPKDTEALRAYLDRYDIALCGGWCSGHTLVNDFKAEQEATRQQVEQFVALGSPVIVYAECSNTVQGQPDTPLSQRVKLDRDGVTDYGKRLGEVAKWMADAGMPMSYHPHMGTIIQDEDDLNWFMEAAPDEVGLCFDTGHLLFGGADVMRAMERWSHRINHVHFKDIRPAIVEDVTQNDRAFLDAVVAGAFTVPGDGCIDFHAVGSLLARIGFEGWIVVEAEQDPAKAPPYEYSDKGYKHILDVCAATGLEVET